MRKLLFLLLLVSGVASAQSVPTGSKTRWANGVYIGTKLDAYFNAADSNAVYWRADSIIMAKYKGAATELILSRGTQTITGSKTFSQDIIVNSLRVGRGGSNIATNTVLGDSSMQNITTAGLSTAIGYGAMKLSTSADRSTAIGSNTLEVNTTGIQNTALGAAALRSSTTGNDNTGLGYDALHDNTTASNNTGAGASSLYYNILGSNNTALGWNAGAYYTGNTNMTSTANSVFIGYRAKAAANSQTNQVVIGYDAVGNGSNTVTIGNSSTTDNYFTGTLRSTSVNTTGNVTSTGGYFYGQTTSSFARLDNSVGAQIGFASIYNNYSLYDADGSSLYTNSIRRLRADNSGNIIIDLLGTGTVYSNSGTLTNTNPSDSTIKNTIKPLGYGLAEVLKLQPKTFYYNSDSAKTSLKYGFIAQEVKPIMPDLVRKISKGSDKLGLETDGIYVTLVKAIQEQQAIIDDLKKRIIALENK